MTRRRVRTRVVDHQRTSRQRATRQDVGQELLIHSGLITLAAKLVLVPVLFDPSGEDAFGVPKSAVSRALMYVLMLLTAVCLATTPLARARLATSRTVVGALAAIVAGAGLSTAFAVDTYSAIYGVHHRYLGLTSMLDGVLTSLATLVFVASRRAGVVIVGSLLVGSGIVAAYGALQVLGLDPVKWSEVTLSSTMGNRGVLAGFLVVTASVVTLLAVGERALPRWRRSLAVLVSLGVISVILIVASGARGPAIALPIALVGALTLALRRREYSPRKPSLLLLVALVAGLGFVVAAPRVSSLARASDTSLLERSIVYESAFDMIRARPLLGAGPDGFAVQYGAFEPVAAIRGGAALAPAQTSAHSWFLHHAVGTGVVGLTALLTLAGAAMWRAWKLAKSANAAVVVGGVVVFAFLLQGAFNVTSVASDYLLWAGIGLATARIHEPGQAERAASGPQRSWVPVAAIALGLVCASTTLNWLGANREVRASDLLRQAGRLPEAELAALRAVERDPGRANNWNVLGLARSAQSPHRALQAFERAHSAAPFEPRYLINVVKEEMRMAETDPRYLERAGTRATELLRLAPQNAEVNMVTSFLWLRAGDPSAARSFAERAIELSGGAPSYFEWSAAIHEDTGDPKTALARYQRYAELTAHGALTVPVRVRLAELHVKAGEPERGRSFVAPRVTAAGRVCERACYGVVLRFDAPLGLAAAGPGSARAASKYEIDGRALPPGAEVVLNDAQTVTLLDPTGAELVLPTSRVTLRGISDVRGNPIDPEPTTIAVR